MGEKGVIACTLAPLPYQYNEKGYLPYYQISLVTRPGVALCVSNERFCDSHTKLSAFVGWASSVESDIVAWRFVSRSA